MKSKFVNAGYVLKSRIAVLNPKKEIQSNPVYFIHIPKTAGTTFLRLLYASEDHALIFPNAYEHFIKNHGQHLHPKDIMGDEALKKELQYRKWIVGHFTYPMIHDLSTDPKMITFLRKPFDRIVSEIAHLKTRSVDYSHLTISEIITRRKEIMGCRSATSFGYVPRLQNLDEAIEHLHQCTFVGLTEAYQESLEKCNQLMDTRFKASTHQNVGDHELRSEIVDLHGDEISQMTEVDTKFYAAGLKIYQNQ